MVKKRFVFSELEKGGLILFITMGVYNFLNFLFHFAMGRFLGPENYGVLAVLMSLVYIYGIPSEAIQNIISKYTSKFNLKKEDGKIKYLVKRAMEKGIKIAAVFFLILGCFSIFLAKYLGIDYKLILITNIVIFSAFLTPTIRGVLQGRKKFSQLGGIMISESALKLFFAISLILLGFKVFGAMIGVLLGVGASFIFSIYSNKDVINSKEEETSFDGIYKASVPYFLSMLVIYLVLSADIILAKRFFSAEISGQYAVLSMLGKMIFFGTAAISKAMFPLTCENAEKGKETKNLFKKASLILLALCFGVIIVYYLVPELVIRILYGSQYLEISSLLVYSAIALTFLSLTNLNLNYGLSANGLRKSRYLFIFWVFELLLLYNFHNDLFEYILAFMVSNIIMFIGSFFFILNDGKENKHNNACL